MLQVASARFARFSYCGRGFAHSARFTSYGNPECMIEVDMCMGYKMKVNLVMSVTVNKCSFSVCLLGWVITVCMYCC